MSTELSSDLSSHYASTASTRMMATVCSFVAGMGLILLLPILYLFVDLMVLKGHIPSYSQLSPGRQQEFRDSWNRDPDAVDVIRKAHSKFASILETNANERAEWETRWQSTILQSFSKISPEVAEEYIHISPNDNHGLPVCKHTNLETRLGILPTVARENGSWTGYILGKVAHIFPWTWKPGTSGSANEAYLITLFVVAFLLAASSGFFTLAARHFATEASIDSATRLRRAVYLQSFRLGVVAVSPVARAEAARMLSTQIDLIRDGLEATYLTSLRNPFVILGTIVVLLLINPFVALIVLCGGAAIWLVGGQIAAWFRRDARLADRVADASRVRLSESVERLGLTKAYLMDRFAQNRVERQLDDVASADRRRRRGVAFSRPMLSVLAGISSVILMLILGGICVNGGISLAGLVETMAGAGLLAWTIRSSSQTRVFKKQAQGGEADVIEFLSRRGDPGQPIDAEFLQPITKRIEFLCVGVREPGTGIMHLDEIKAVINAGTRVAVLAGDRETLHAFAQVLTRFVEPTAGEIKADGKNLRWITIDSLRTQIATVNEDSMIFTDTVANNIGCGDAGFGLPQIMEAAKVAHAHQFIQKLPYGYETLVGGPGVVLTPGQQYRIALARAILRDPSVLVIEEPTAALDADSLALVDDTIARIQPGRTVIILAHREATMRTADQILVIENGRIVANGTHEMLVQSSESYRRLGYRQISGNAS